MQGLCNFKRISFSDVYTVFFRSTGVHMGQKLMSQNWFKTAWNDSQSVWKYHSNIDFERKKVEKKLWFFKVTNLHFFFLGLFSNLVLKVKLYYSLFIDIIGLPPLLTCSTMSIFHELTFLSSWPAVAQTENWIFLL